MLRIIYKTKQQTSSIFTASSIRSFSSNEGGGLFSSLKNKIIPSQEDQYKQQITTMAEAPTWTISHFHKQIKDSTGGWRSMIPGASSTQTVKQMNAMKKLLQATMDVLGESAGANELKEMSKKEKLQISLKCGAELKDINSLVSSFESMDIMHRILRRRVENGKSIPLDEESAKVMMQTEAVNVLTPAELKNLQRARMKMMKNRYK